MLQRESKISDELTHSALLEDGAVRVHLYSDDSDISLNIDDMLFKNTLPKLGVLPEEVRALIDYVASFENKNCEYVSVLARSKNLIDRTGTNSVPQEVVVLLGESHTLNSRSAALAASIEEKFPQRTCEAISPRCPRPLLRKLLKGGNLNGFDKLRVQLSTFASDKILKRKSPCDTIGENELVLSSNRTRILELAAQQLGDEIFKIYKRSNHWPAAQKIEEAANVQSAFLASNISFSRSTLDRLKFDEVAIFLANTANAHARQRSITAPLLPQAGVPAADPRGITTSLEHIGSVFLTGIPIGLFAFLMSKVTGALTVHSPLAIQNFSKLVLPIVFTAITFPAYLVANVLIKNRVYQDPMKKGWIVAARCAAWLIVGRDWLMSKRIEKLFKSDEKKPQRAIANIGALHVEGVRFNLKEKDWQETLRILRVKKEVEPERKEINEEPASEP